MRFQHVVAWFLVGAACAAPVAPSARASVDERWLEIVEQYDLPEDPQWRSTAEQVDKLFGPRSPAGDSASKSRGKGNSKERPSDSLNRPGGMLGGGAGDPIGRFAAATRSVDQLGEFRKRLEQAGSNERSRQAVITSIEREVDRIVSSKDASRKLTVVRAWDGIKRESVCVVLGERQRALAARCKVGAAVWVQMAASNCADHYQANGRPTLLDVKPKQLPSEFLRADEGPAELRALKFGSVDAPSEWSGTATKSPTVGSGEFTVSFELPDGLDIDPGLPWYCEFKLFRLDGSGKRTAETRFTGPAVAVCVSTGSKPATTELPGVTGKRTPAGDHLGARPTYAATATAVVEVADPGPHGYVAVGTRLWGARRQSDSVAPSGASGAGSGTPEQPVSPANPS